MWKFLHGVWELFQSVAAAIWAPDSQTMASPTRQKNKDQIQLFSHFFLLTVVPDPTFNFDADPDPDPPYK